MTAQTSGAPGAPGGDKPPMKEQAKHAAGTATDEGKRVAGVAGDEAKQVASEVQAQARDLLGELRTQVTDQSRTQRDRIVQALHELTSELDEMADAAGRSGVATEVVRQVSAKAKELGSMLDGKEPSDVLGDVRRMARRRPGSFLLGAMAAGVLAGRITRGAKTDTSSTTTDGATTGAYGGAETPGTTGTYGGTSTYGSPTPPATSAPATTPPVSAPPPTTPNFQDPVEPGLTAPPGDVPGEVPGQAPGYRPGTGGGTP